MAQARLGLRLVVEGHELQVLRRGEPRRQARDGPVHADLEHLLVAAVEGEGHAEDDEQREHQVPRQRAAIAQELVVARDEHGPEALGGAHSRSSLPVSSRKRSSSVRARTLTRARLAPAAVSAASAASTSEVMSSMVPSRSTSFPGKGFAPARKSALGSSMVTPSKCFLSKVSGSPCAITRPRSTMATSSQSS